MAHIFLTLFGLILVGLLIGLLPHIDCNKRVEGSDWRVRPSRSGKTWEAYRYTKNWGEEEKFTRFKSAAAAEEFIRRRQQLMPPD